MSTSMINGSPLKSMLRFATALYDWKSLQQTYNIIDAAIVGQALGADALASVGASSSVQFLVLGFCMGITAGFGIPVAKFFGSGNYQKMKNYVYNGAVLTAGTAAIVTTACALLCHWILNILSVQPDIYKNAYAYLLVIFLGLPFTLMYNYLSSILRSVGDSRTPFLFLAFSAVFNIFLDLFCIIVLGWDVQVQPLQQLLHRLSAELPVLSILQRKKEILWLPTERRKGSSRQSTELLTMGLPTGLQYSITAIGSMVMQSANNGLGSIYVSGFTAGMRIKQFAMCPFDAIGTAVSVFCSQNLGAGQYDRIKKGLGEGIAAGVGYGLLAGILMIFGGRTLSMIFVSRDAVEVLDASAKYLRCMGYFFWTLGILNITRMTTQGLGYSSRAFFSGVTEMIARTIVSIGFVGTFGFTAICFADQTAWVTACCYIAPTCFYCVKKVSREEKERA